MQRGQFVHAMAMKAAFEYIGDQHGIVDRCNFEAVAFEDAQIIFQILSDLEHGGIGQERP